MNTLKSGRFWLISTKYIARSFFSSDDCYYFGTLCQRYAFEWILSG
jgi:hypothetical protein